MITKEQEKLLLDAISYRDPDLVLPLLKQLLVSFQSEPNMKFKLYDLCAADDDAKHVQCQGIYHENGYLIATDGHILAKIKDDYDAKFEGKTIARNGKSIEAKFPNYRSIIPNGQRNLVNLKYSDVADLMKIFKAERKADKYCVVLGKVIDGYYTAQLLYKFACVCKERGMRVYSCDWSLGPNMRLLYGENDDGEFTVITCVSTTGCQEDAVIKTICT